MRVGSDLGSQRVGSGSAVFFIFMESRIRILYRRIKFSSLLGLGIKILVKNMGSVKKNISHYYPEKQLVRDPITNSKVSNIQ